MTLQSVFLHLLNMSITAGWLVLAVAVLRLVFRRAPKWIHCLLWVMVAVRLLCPISIESALSLIPSAETVPVESFTYDTPAINSGVPVVDNAVNPVLSENFTPQPEASVNPMQVVTAVAAYVWVAGVAIMLLYAAIATIRLRVQVRESVRLRDNVFRCDRIASPFILGVIRPKIYLPTTLSDADEISVVAHEQTHLHRRDHWWKPLGFLLLTVYWFNPLLWVGYVLLCRDIESACDERVIREMDVSQRKSYSQALLTCSAPRHLVTACPLAFGETGVKSRIKSVLNYKKPAFWLIIVAIVATTVAAVCLLTNPTSDEKLDEALTEIILAENQSKHSGFAYPTEAHTVFGTRKKDDKITAYALVLYEEYYRDGTGALETVNSSHIPTAITLGTHEDGTYYCEEYWTPGDGTQYLPDMKEKFPFFYRIRVDTDKYYDVHHRQTLADAEEYFGLEGDDDSTSFENVALDSRGIIAPYVDNIGAVFGDVDYSNENLPVRVMNSLEEFQTFVSDYCSTQGSAASADSLLDLYTSPVFDRNVLVAVYYTDGSSSVQPQVVAMTSEAGSGKATLFVDVYSPYMQNDAVGSWIMLTTIDREYAENITTYSAQVRGYIASNQYAAAFKQAVEEPVGAQEEWRDRLTDNESMYLYKMTGRLSWGERSMKANSGTYIGAFNNEGVTYYVSADYSFICTEDKMAYLPAEDSDFLRELFMPRGGVTYITPYWREQLPAGMTTSKLPKKDYWLTLGHPMTYDKATQISGGYSLSKSDIKKIKNILKAVEWRSDAPDDAQLFEAYFMLDDSVKYYVNLDVWGESGYLYNGKEYATLTKEQSGQLDFMLNDCGSVSATHYLYGNYAESNKAERYFVLDVVWADDASLIGKKIRVNHKYTGGRGSPHIGTMIEASYDGTVIDDMIYALGWGEQDKDVFNNKVDVDDKGTFTGKVIHVADGSVLMDCYDKGKFDIVWVIYKNAYPNMKPQMGEEYTVTHDGMVMETYPQQVIATEMLAVSSTPLKNTFISAERALEIAMKHWNVEIGVMDQENGYYTTVYVLENPTEENPKYTIGKRYVDEQNGGPGNSALNGTLYIDAVTGEIIRDTTEPG